MRRLGAVIAGKLADEGYQLALSSHIEGEPDAGLAAKLLANASNWRAFPADLSDPAAASILIADVIRHFGCAPDLLVNNAAIFGQDDWQEMSAETLDAHFRVNFFSPALLATELLKSAEERSQPAIIQILDQRIVNPHGDQFSYTLSKQALAASVRSMASAFAGRARVNAVAPGLVIETQDYDAGQIERLAAMMPLGNLPKPESVANAVAYLAKAEDVTGQIIFADGGAHLKSFDRDFMFL
jgi:NAD(P)-dependent dehydrogenase (short-subunit alcohol dehydrogenase family)